MQSLIVIARAVLCAAFVCLSAHAQAAPADEATRKAELMAAWEAASKAGTDGPSAIALIDQGTLKLPVDYFYIPKSEGLRVLRALGNVVNDATFVGLVVGRRQNDDWMVVIKHIKEGYIKDDDAKNWNADELLSNLRAGADEANQDRVARGFPEMAVIGWVEPPAYDATTHRLVWSLLAKQKGEPDDAPKNVNYNTFALGRDGYFSLNPAPSGSRTTRRSRTSSCPISPTMQASATRISARARIGSPNMDCWPWSVAWPRRSSDCWRWPAPSC
ncbi:putative transmembrane protein [Bradyrhizobium oligotrophicum S58]|uniref:Putative transmembrane protein n=1 Tax=Bradyrhizobium oligotrophicum S58 TaxID=1245469 RepID=M4Z8C5_9BRAD|nr:putative transmembrane protein [Bradyrhizobium oligotrophicum S58]